MLTRAEYRIMSNCLNGIDPFDGGGNGPTRAVIHRLNERGLLRGHVLTASGLTELEARPGTRIGAMCYAAVAKALDVSP